MSIKPTRGYCLVEPDKAEEKTAGGLFVPETAQEKPQKGIVVEVGIWKGQEGMGIPIASLTEAQWVNPPCKSGNKVYYKKWAGDEITEGGKTLKFVRFEDILAVIE